jgi:hypothetical protein
MPSRCDQFVTKAASVTSVVAFALSLLAGLSSASAQTVILTPTANNLYNTGYNGTTFATGNEADSHYTVTNYSVFGGLAYHSNPVQPLWVPNATTGDSQWDSVVPHVVPTNTPPAPFTFGTFDYQLTLTNIPVGALVHIVGLVAADDNATVTANGSTPYFTNASSHVVVGNFAHQVAFSGVTFVAGATNEVTIIVSNVGGGPTGLNLSLDGSYYTALTTTVGLGIQLAPRFRCRRTRVPCSGTSTRSTSRARTTRPLPT